MVTPMVNIELGHIYDAFCKPIIMHRVHFNIKGYRLVNLCSLIINLKLNADLIISANVNELLMGLQILIPNYRLYLFQYPSENYEKI